MVIANNKAKKKLVFMLGSFGQNNIGDEIILQSFLKFIKKDKNTPIVSSRNPNQTHKIYKIDTCHTTPFKNFWKKIKIILKADIYLFAGGTIIVEHPLIRNGKVSYFRTPLYFVLALVILGKLLRKKVLLSHIGISPLESSLSRLIATIILNLVDLTTVRDKNSFLIAKGINSAKKCHVVSDSAFSILEYPKVKQIKKARKKLIIIPNYYSFPSIVEDRDQAVEKYKILIKEILKQKLFDEVLLVPFRINYGEKDDLWIANKICKEVHDKRVSVIIVKQDIKLVTNIQNIIKKSDFVITQRQHGMIISYVLGIPFIAANLDPKIASFMRENGLKNNNIELKKLNIRKLNQILNQKNVIDINKVNNLKTSANLGFKMLRNYL